MALKHEYFVESPLPVDPSMFPTWPAKSEQPRRTHGNSPKPPSGGKAFSKLLVGTLEHCENNTVFKASIEKHEQLILIPIYDSPCFQKILKLSIDQLCLKKNKQESPPAFTQEA